MTKSDSKLDRMVADEELRWLKSRGPAGGTLVEFTAHVSMLMQTDDEWRAAAIERYAEKLVAAYRAGRKRLSKPRPIKGADERQVHMDHATVADFICHADLLQKRAKTKVERTAADAMMMAAETARERAGGNLDTPLRDVSDKVWPARETRQ